MNAHDSPAKNSRINRLQRKLICPAVFANLNATRHCGTLITLASLYRQGNRADKYLHSVNMSKLI
ncbi:hypothetical protein EH264_06500 [Salmonella enterica]|uniref:Uncharacterized protein n=3 Tax=Salmonella enterica TaxID=28901 RepID=A0A5V4KFD0_SALER|nr:hypothetical protein [Salmonella enterica subsp. enterica serovar Newport]EAA5790419.1 hypothetical protein [Salmonella enterica]EAA9729069.1 hypothetical protein [Salmonella enterica subsp. enterica]EAB0111461.1 hypothetical protein [Salmonella enterica subsp. enterica serovar Schwarzengrund]EBB5075831.1 hypothetical protein [Salmonella enterica subsp. enterica serovar Typhimurium]EBF9786753.1 hypothetical protein [Salmonella enterica subsp. enterica serovar Bredeney]EBG9515287.1 hypothet